MDTQTPEKHDVRLIVVDVDGTLMSNDHKLSERNRNAIKEAMAAGVPVMLATGKTRVSAETMIAELGLDTPGVFVQGLVIHNADGSVRHQQTLDVATVRRIITFAEDRGFEVLLYSGTRLLARRRHEGIDVVTKYGEPTPDVVGPLPNQLGTVSVNKLCIIGEPKRIKALRWQLDQQMSGQVNFTFSHVPEILEVLPAGASKGRGVKMALGEMGIAPENVMAIGDGENDLEMLKLVGVGVAVENASPLLKAVAKYHVASNEQDGVAEAIERFVLAPRRPAPAQEPAPVIVVSTPEAATAPATETTPAAPEAAAAPAATEIVDVTVVTPKPTEEQDKKE